MIIARTAVLLALIAPAAASQTPLGDFKLDTKQRLAQLAQDIRDQDDTAADALLDLRDAVQAGTLAAADAHAALAVELDAFLDDRARFMADFTDGLESDASDALADMAFFLQPLVVGEAGQDATRRAAAKRLGKSAGRHAKRVAVFAKSLQKSTKYDLVFDLRHPLLEPITPSENATAAPQPAMALRIDLALGGSERLVSDDGRLILGGTANRGAGDVTVTIDLPGEEQRQAAASVDAESGRWSVTFGDDTGLPEGNWAVTASQGGVSVSDSLGVQ